MTTPPPPPEAQLIAQLRSEIVPPLSMREAARRAGFSAATWSQIEQGYRKVTSGVIIPIRGTGEKIARMALIVGATPDQLTAAGRPEAAKMLEKLAEAGPGPIERLPEVIKQSRELNVQQKTYLLEAIEHRTGVRNT